MNSRIASHKIKRAIRLLQAAIASLDESIDSVRRPEWFRPSGHLSEGGIAHLQALFARGVSAYAAAQEMGITDRSAANRQKRSRAIVL